MAVTPGDLKQLFPEFTSIPNSRLQLYLDQAARQVNTCAWGSRADDGISYLAAHLVATMGQDQSAAGQGVVTQKRVGDVSAAYGYGAKTLESAYGSTKYGRTYEQLQSLVVGCRCL